MDDYFEKGNYKLVEKCERFVNENRDKKGIHSIASKALKLSKKLIGSLLRSQRFFDRRIKDEMQIIESAQSDIQKEIYMLNFNNKKIVLRLDARAHEALESLELIIKNNF